MKQFTILQWGSNRSIVELTYPDTYEIEYLIMDNDYLMKLDEMYVIQ